MKRLELVRQRRAEIERVASRHGAYNVRVFGSVVREQDSPDSDVDFLVATEERTSPWFPAGLVLDLQDLLGCPVEVVTEKGLSPFLRQSILEEARPL